MSIEIDAITTECRLAAGFAVRFLRESTDSEHVHD
jgi:hypothetical protein